MMHKQLTQCGVAALVALVVTATTATSYGAPVWVGNGTDNKWSTAANWTAAPNPGETINFVVTTWPTVYNDLVAFNAGEMRFSASGFTVDGNALTVTGIKLQNGGGAPWDITVNAAISAVGFMPITALNDGAPTTLTMTGGLTTGAGGRVDKNGYGSGGVANLLKFDGGTVNIGDYLRIRGGWVEFAGGAQATFANNDGIVVENGATGSGVTPKIIIDGAGTLVTAGRIKINNFSSENSDFALTDGAVYASNSGLIAGDTGGIHNITFDNGTMRANASADFLPTTRGFVVDILAGGMTADTNGNSMTMSEVLGGVGGLTKVGLGSLTLNGLNTYTGDTVVEEGTLSLAEAYLDDASTVNLFDGTTLNLTHLGTDVVGQLIVDGANMGAGLYNSSNTTFITGTGSIQVVPEPATMALLVLGGLAVIRRK